MIVEEERAATFRCCNVAMGGSVYCSGSRCMAWRWDKEEIEGSRNAHGNSTTHGYCGLAGRP